MFVQLLLKCNFGDLASVRLGLHTLPGESDMLLMQHTRLLSKPLRPARSNQASCNFLAIARQCLRLGGFFLEWGILQNTLSVPRRSTMCTFICVDFSRGYPSALPAYRRPMFQFDSIALLTASNCSRLRPESKHVAR